MHHHYIDSIENRSTFPLKPGEKERGRPRRQWIGSYTDLVKFKESVTSKAIVLYVAVAAWDGPVDDDDYPDMEQAGDYEQLLTCYSNSCKYGLGTMRNNLLIFHYLLLME
jgi:hypothetical protein